MNYHRYMKQGQKLLLRVQGGTAEKPRMELTSTVLASLDGNRAIVSVAHTSTSIDHYPFVTGTCFELTTEAMGMGVKVTGRFEKKLNDKCFALSLEKDLELFQRQLHPRINCDLGIRFSRAAKTLHQMRDIWERNLAVLYGKDAPLIFEGFKRIHVNISAGGIRFIIKPPADPGDLCLLLIKLDDSKPPICAIAEIVWKEVHSDIAIAAGMRFVNILSEDQDRINTFVNQKT